jgi:hypothetical protein
MESGHPRATDRQLQLRSRRSVKISLRTTAFQGPAGEVKRYPTPGISKVGDWQSPAAPKQTRPRHRIKRAPSRDATRGAILSGRFDQRHCAKDLSCVEFPLKIPFQRKYDALDGIQPLW